MRKQENQLRPIYEAPQTTVMEVLSEGCILSASNPKGEINDFEGNEWGTSQQNLGIF